MMRITTYMKIRPFYFSKLSCLFITRDVDMIEKFAYNNGEILLFFSPEHGELMRRIIPKLGLVTGARTVRLVILRKRQHGGLTIAGMLRHPQTNTAPCKRSGSETGITVWRNVILRSHMVSCRGCNCCSGAITRLSRQRPRVRGLSGSL